MGEFLYRAFILYPMIKILTDLAQVELKLHLNYIKKIFSIHYLYTKKFRHPKVTLLLSPVQWWIVKNILRTLILYHYCCKYLKMALCVGFPITKSLQLTWVSFWKLILIFIFIFNEIYHRLLLASPLMLMFIFEFDFWKAE